MKFILGNKNETKTSVNNVNMSILITTGNHFWTIFLRRVSLVEYAHLKFATFEIRKVIACDPFQVTLGFIPNFCRDESRSHISSNETLEGAMVQTSSYFTFASFSISDVPRFASAIVGAESVVAVGIFMAHGRGCRTFIDIYYKRAKTKKKRNNNNKPWGFKRKRHRCWID